LRPPADLLRVVRPDALPPVAIAARLGVEEVEERVAVSAVAGGHPLFGYLLVEERADPLHRAEDVVVSLHPGDVVGPAAALHVEASIFLLEVLDGLPEL